MRDRNNLTIRQGDRLLIQTGGPDSPVCHGTAESTEHGYCKDLGLVLVRFDNGTGQYMEEKVLEVVSHPCGRCGKGEAAGAAGLCQECNSVADDAETASIEELEAASDILDKLRGERS